MNTKAAMSGGAALDHVGLVAPGLDALVARYRALGFAPTEPRPLLRFDAATGASLPIGQSSAHAVFESGYVELTQIDGASRDHHLAPWVGRHFGLHILALGADDIAAAHERCTSAGVPVRAAARASRAIEYGSRQGEARFEWFMLEPAASPEGLLCLVRHETPGLVHQREVESHPNGAVALEGVYIVTAEPREVERRLVVVAGARPAEAGTIELGGRWIRVLTPDVFAARFPGAQVPATPCMAGFAVRVADLRRARGAVAPGLVTPAPAPGGGFWVDAPHAGGCVVEFTG
jgi:catechol 2,3-dioxygenase-like lactoylglutathione lyase family enzyme